MECLSPTDRALSAARERLEKVHAANRLIDEGWSAGEAAKRLEVSPASLSRWRKAFANAEAKGKNPLEALAPRSTKSGRRPKFTLTEEETKSVRRLVLQRSGSLPLAMEEFVRHPACRPETREVIYAMMDEAAQRRRPVQYPPSLRRAARVTRDEAARFRGRKATQGEEMVNRRALCWVDSEGVERPPMANVLFESDDMSGNAPFYYPDEDRGGFRLGRQILATVDAFTLEGIGVEPIARPKDAYRSEDILRHMLRVIDGRGTLPLLWRLEQGAWASQAVDGVKLPCGRVFGSLTKLFQVQHVVKSKGKPFVEGSFDLIQAITDHHSATIGRSRGEFEDAAKAMGRINGNKQAWSEELVRKNGFVSVRECAELYVQGWQRFNERPKERQGYGYISPADMRARHPGDVRPLPQGQRWRFCPVKRLATVRGGHVQMQVKDYREPFRFAVNGVVEGLHLENGYRVLVAFDPQEPAAGCWVFNYEEGAINRHGWAYEEHIMMAPLEERTPVVDFSGLHGRENLARRKKANATANAEYRSIVPRGQKPYQVSARHDGEGNFSKIETGRTASDDREDSADDVREVRRGPAEVARKRDAGEIETPRSGGGYAWLDQMMADADDFAGVSGGNENDNPNQGE